MYSVPVSLPFFAQRIQFLFSSLIFEMAIILCLDESICQLPESRIVCGAGGVVEMEHVVGLASTES